METYPFTEFNPRFAFPCHFSIRKAMQLLCSFSFFVIYGGLEMSTSSGVVRAHIASILEDEEFSLDTPRMKLARSTAREILCVSSASEQAMEKFDTFAAKLIKEIQPVGKFSNSAKRRKLWSDYHSMRCSGLGILWEELYIQLGIGQEHAADCLLQQYVNDKLFQEIINSKLVAEEEDSREFESDLNIDECQALRYVAGYVPYRLVKKFKKSSHPLKDDFLICLEKMRSSDEEGEESFLDYTKRWVKAIDRGGLFTINDDVYIFFKSIEIKIRQHLNITQHMHDINKEKTLKDILSDMDVQFFWSFLSTDLDDEVAEQLLKEIAQFWQTIRGFQQLQHTWRTTSYPLLRKQKNQLDSEKG